jgi:hypothetical protein
MEKIDEDDDDEISVSPWSDDGDDQDDSRSDNPEVKLFI